MILCAGRCVYAWIYSLVRGGFRAEDLNGGQWPVRIIMGVLGAAEVLAEQILNPPKKSTAVSAYLFCSLFHSPVCPSFSIFTKNLCTVENECACEAGLSLACNHFPIFKSYNPM